MIPHHDTVISAFVNEAPRDQVADPVVIVRECMEAREPVPLSDSPELVHEAPMALDLKR